MKKKKEGSQKRILKAAASSQVKVAMDVTDSIPAEKTILGGGSISHVVGNWLNLFEGLQEMVHSEFRHGEHPAWSFLELTESWTLECLLFLFKR